MGNDSPENFPHTLTQCGRHRPLALDYTVMAIPAPEKIEAFISDSLAEQGLTVEAVKVVRAGAKSQLIVLIDGDERPTLDKVEDATALISADLDAAEARGDANFGSQGYTLEVSTPGIDTPLTKPRHWQRNSGRIVQIRLSDGGQLVGRIGALSDEQNKVVIITSVGPKGRPKAVINVIDFDEVTQAVVQVEFSTPPAVEMDCVRLSFDDALTRLEENK